MSSRTKFIIFKIIEVITLITPMITLVSIRADKWFVKKSVVEVSTGAILALITSLFLLKGYWKKVSGIVWAGILTIIAYLLSSIMQDAYMIFGVALMGLVISYPFKMLASRYKHIADLVRDEYVKTYARDKAREEIERGK